MSQSSNNEFIFSIFAGIGAIVLVAVIEVSALTALYGSVTAKQATNTMAKSEDVAQRIKPVVTLADIRGGSDTKKSAPVVVATEKSAKELYDATCMACHANAVAGAPKPGDKAAWEVRYANGFESLLAAVKNGKGAMPPKGGSAYSDAELTKIIEYMLIESDLMDANSAVAMPEKAVEPAVMSEPKADVVAAPVKEVVMGSDSGLTSDNQIAEHEEINSAVDLAAGEKAYRGACFACHDFAVAGAPKLGDAAAWETRKAMGLDALVNAAINGKGAMPAKGGAAYLSDTDVRNIVGFMLSKI